MEIERKFLVLSLPENFRNYPCLEIHQAYLSTDPVVRIRRSNQDYYLTYKGKGLLSREEYNLPLTESSFYHLLQKADGIPIHKKRYQIPFQDKYMIELDLFEDALSPLILAEVEFESEEEALAFQPPDWFGEDVTFQSRYHNSHLSTEGLTKDSSSI